MKSDLYFFPNVSPDIQRMELRLRQHVESLSELSRFAVYELFSEAHPDLVESRFEPKNDKVFVRQNGMELVFPSPLPLVKFSHILFGYEEWLRRKYALPGFVEVEDGDIVVDCGGYVGGFSLSAAKKANSVHIFEPEHLNFECISLNIGQSENVIANECGLYSESKEILLNISASSVEHSILTPDDGEVLDRIKIRVLSLSDYCNSSGLESLDFVKIEAEGVELEVFEGLKELMPKKLAIDVSEERNGMSPAHDFKKILQPLGYEVRQRGHVMFARIP